MTFWDYDGLAEIRDDLVARFPVLPKGAYPIVIRNNDIIRELLTKYLWVAESVEDTVHLYTWNSFYYQEVFRPDMEGIVKRVYNLCGWNDYKHIYGSEVLEQIRNDVHLKTRERGIHINDHSEMIPFKNGLYNIDTGGFMPPSPDIIFTFTLEVPFSQDQNCPVFKAFIQQIIPNEEDRKDVLAFMSYSLTSSIHKKIAHVWTGAGRNGKTTLTNILTMIVGMRNTCHVSLDQLMGDNRFIKIRMKSKQLNLGSEITYDDIEPSGIRQFKEVITNRFLSGEKKGKDGEEWVNITKHIFDVNELPLPKVMMDFAFYRRFHVIPFKVIIPENQIIDNLDLKIFNAEGPQIAAYLLSFMAEIDRYLIETPEETERRWFRNTMSVLVFITETCEEDYGNYFTPTYDLYDLYTNWCNSEAKKAISRNQFTRLITKTTKISHVKKGFQSGFTVKCNYIPTIDLNTDGIPQTVQANQMNRGVPN